MSKQETAVKITETHPLSRLGDLICCALEGGGYSTFHFDPKQSEAPSDSSTIPEEWREYSHVGWALGEDGHVSLRNRYAGQGGDDFEARGWRFRLNRESLQAGLAVFREKCPRHYATFMMEDEDFETGDAYLQCVALGKEVYG